MAGILMQEGGQEPPSPSDLQHAGSNGKANGSHTLVSAADVQTGHLKAGAKESPKRKKVRVKAMVTFNLLNRIPCEGCI